MQATLNSFSLEEGYRGTFKKGISNSEDFNRSCKQNTVSGAQGECQDRKNNV